MNRVMPGARPAPPRLGVRADKSAELLIRSATLLDPRAGLEGHHDLLLRKGRIAEISAPGSLNPPEGAETIEAEGLHVLPAFVDPHVHLRVPGREDEEDVQSGTRAAAAGGYCMVLAMPNTDPVVDTASVLRSLLERAGAEARVPVGFLAAVTRGQDGRDLTEMAELADEGAVGFSDDGVPIAEASVLRQALQYQRLCGRVLALHEEDPSLSGNGAMHEGAVSTLLGLSGIPSVSESTMVERDAALAAYEGARLHVLHVSAAESVAAVERAKAAGVQITAEVTPHHLTLTDEAVMSLDPNFKMNPPLRAERDREALIEGLRSGLIDCVATDHAPHSREEKEEPFERAPMGVTGLETAFSALYTELVVSGRLSLPVLAERMSAGAALYDLPVPSLAKGSDANLCLVDLEAEWTVGENGYESRSANSCFAARTLRGRVLVTLAAGAVAYRERGFSIRLAGRLGEQLSAAQGGALKLERERAALVVVDVQEAFRPAVAGFDEVARNVGVLVQGAKVLGVPILVTEQYPKGLGRTVPEVADHLEGVEPIEKVCFSAADSQDFERRLSETGRNQVLLCGIESHVCVNQTADDLLARQLEVHVAQDAVTSRTADNRELGLHKMEHAGAVVTSTETALFELLRAAGTPEFKEIQALVK